MGPKAFVPCIYCPWPLFTQQDLAERSPTRVYRNEDGVFKGQSQKKEEQEIKTVLDLMCGAGVVLKLHHAMPTAIVFARRYYSVKSLQENDRFIVACACLFLAAKCEEEMRALNDVCYQTYRSRYKQNPEALKNMQNAEFFNSFKEIVLTAERSLLYALGFQLDIRHPYYWSTTILKRLGSLPGNGQPGDGPWWREYSQRTCASRTNFINDLYRRTTLVLRYDLRIIAFAVIHVTIPIMYLDIGRPTANHDKVPLIDLEPWYSYVLKTERPEVVEGAASSTPSRASTTYEPEQKVTVSLLIEISKEIMSLYGKAKKGPPQAPGAAAKPRGPEMGPDGPITPLVEEFGTPRPDGSPTQVDADGKSAADGAEPGSGAAAPVPGAKTGLNPAAANFVPGAAQAQAESSAAPASASADVAGLLPRQPAIEQPHVQRMSRKRSSDEAGLQEQTSPAKRAAPATCKEISSSGSRVTERSSAGSTQPAQPPSNKQSHEGASIPGVDMEVEPSAATASAEPQSNDDIAQAEPMDTLPSAVDGVQPDQSDSVLLAGAMALTNHAQPAGASDLANGLPPAEGAETAPAVAGDRQQAPSTKSGAQAAGSAALPNGMQPSGAPMLHGHPSVASEEGELLAEMQALEEPYQPQAAADPAAASERLKKWQAGQVQQKAEVEGSSKPEQLDQEAGADELEAALEGLDSPAQPKQAHTDPAVASERRKKLQQQLQALNAQKAT